MCQNITIFIAYRSCLVVMFLVTCVPREESDLAVCLLIFQVKILITSKNIPYM